MKYANYVDSQWDINHIITYIDNEDSDAFKIAENERKKGRNSVAIPPQHVLQRRIITDCEIASVLHP